MKEIKLFKLVSGDVVLGKLDPEDLNKKEFMVEKPMQLMLDPAQGGIGMIPYNALYSQQEPEEHSFKVEHVMEFIPVHESFEEAYIKQTTGIEVGLPEIELGVE